MKRWWWIWVACAVALLSSCGGGDGGMGLASGSTAPGTASSPLLATPGTLRLSAPSPLRSAQPFTAATLFDWAQQNFPQFFAGAGTDGATGPFLYRFYPQTQTYLAVSSDGGVYVKGPQVS